MESAQGLIIPRHLTLALEYVHLYVRLPVNRRCEGLALPGRDSSVALDQLREYAAERLDAERKRRYVQQDDVLDLTAEDSGLDGGAHCYDFVRVHAFVRLLAGELLDQLVYHWHSGCAADQDNLLYVFLGQA